MTISDDQKTIFSRAGIIAGSVVVIAMVTVGIAACYRKKWKQKQLGAVMAKRFFEFSCHFSTIKMVTGYHMGRSCDVFTSSCDS